MGVPYAEVIGDPIAHSKSPLIHKFWLEKLGIDGDYRATRITSKELPAHLTNRRTDSDWRGCSVTIPHKQPIIEFLDDVEDYGVGAVNCVVPRGIGLQGWNTDSGGIGEAVPDRIDTGRPICLIGAGGAARAAVAMLDVYAVFQFNVIARDQHRAEALLEAFGMKGGVYHFEQAEQALKGSVGVINATPLGMRGFPEMPDSVLRGLARVRRGFALDLVYAPIKTRFLDCAARAGLATKDGLVVLIAQAAEAFRLFFGAEAPREYDRELRELLTR